MDAYQAGQQLGTLLFGGAATSKADGSGTADGSPSLFDALSGRVPQGDVYNKTLLTGAQAQNAMMEARMNRAKAMIEENMAAHRQAVTPQAMQTLGYSPASSAALGDILLSSADPDIRRFGVLVNPNAVQALGAAAADMNAGNFAGYNQQTALADGKPYEPVRVVGNTMLPSGVPLGDAAFVAQATPVGQADIGEKTARAGAANALTTQRNTLTPLTAALTQARTAATLHPPVRQKTPSPTSAADDAYIQKAARALASGKSYAQVAAAAQQDGKFDLFLKRFGKQDVQDQGD